MCPLFSANQVENENINSIKRVLSLCRTLQMDLGDDKEILREERGPGGGTSGSNHG